MIRCFKLFRRTDDNTPKYFFPLDHDRPDNGDDGNDRCFTHELLYTRLLSGGQVSSDRFNTRWISIRFLGFRFRNVKLSMLEVKCNSTLCPVREESSHSSHWRRRIENRIIFFLFLSIYNFRRNIYYSSINSLHTCII